MSKDQYLQAEQDLLARLQLIREREFGHVDAMVFQGVRDPLDDPILRPVSSKGGEARVEWQSYCNVVKQRQHTPKSYIGTTVKLGSIEMGQVGEKGEEVRGNPPFIACNLASFVGPDGRFDLLSFLQLQERAFPTIYKLAVCLGSIRTNEVGCERFFSTAGYVSCPRRTSLKVRNYECLATLKANIQNVYIDESWVVDQYLTMEQEKTWNNLDTSDDMLVLTLERELLAETQGISVDSMPPIELFDIEEEATAPEVFEVPDDDDEKEEEEEEEEET